MSPAVPDSEVRMGHMHQLCAVQPVFEPQMLVAATARCELLLGGIAAGGQVVVAGRDRVRGRDGKGNCQRGHDDHSL